MADRKSGLRRRDLLRGLVATAALAWVPMRAIAPALPRGPTISTGPFRVEIGGCKHTIHYTGDGEHCTVLQLHRWLSDWADDPEGITEPTPSMRTTDQIISLGPTYAITDEAVEHLHGGSLYTSVAKYTSAITLGAVE